jgi:hypothetical protein
MKFKNIAENMLCFQKKLLSEKKLHQPIQSKPHWFDLVWFGFYFKSQPNQTKPHTYLSCGSDDF